MKRTVSVIITTYNGEKTIQKTLNSILHQEGLGNDFDLELLVVDDCSTDSTPEILAKNNIEYFSTKQNSGGPNKGRNIALKKVTGDFICVVDHDDVWHKNKISATLPYLLKAPIVTSGFTLIDSSKGKTINRSKRTDSPYLEFKKNATFLSKLTKSLKGQNTYLGSIIYDAKLKDVLFEEQFGVVDFDWVLRLFYQQTSIEVCESLYTRFVDGSNLSLNKNYRKIDFDYSLAFIESLRKEFPKEVALSYKRIHGSRARYYYLIDNMRMARFYFRKAEFNLKNITYYLTTFAGSKFVKKKFNVFG